MNLSYGDSVLLSNRFVLFAEKFKSIDLALLPPSVYLYPIHEDLKARPRNFCLGIQNFTAVAQGEYTGENSLVMVKNICRFALCGHSERRKIFAETDEDVNKKVLFALKNDFQVIACIGENQRYNLEDYYGSESKKMFQEGAVLDQLKKALKGVRKEDLKNLVIAYEPVWAIGTGNNASGAYAAAVGYIIKKELENLFGQSAAGVKLLYGGSVCADNVREYVAQPSIDGVLVGSSSLLAQEFGKICEVCAEVKSGRSV
jgi:triosephosphate isomerase